MILCTRHNYVSAKTFPPMSGGASSQELHQPNSFMPPAPSVALLRSLDPLFGTRSISLCSSCSRLRAPVKGRREGSSPQQLPRHGFRSQSTTAISATKDIPPHWKRVHKSLERLKKHASSYVDLSRLQLALQGLETSKPTIRIGRTYMNHILLSSQILTWALVLGLKDFALVRQLARLLLADPLDPPMEWEKRLESIDWKDRRSLLLR